MSEKKEKEDEKEEDKEGQNGSAEDATKGFEAESKQIDNKSKEIAEKIVSYMEEMKESKEAKEKKKAIHSDFPDVKIVDNDVKLYTTKKVNIKTGSKDVITMKKSQLEQCKEWFKCLVYGDKKKAAEIAYKLGPLVEGTNARGGFLVPTILANFITDVKDDLATIKPRAKIIDMSSMKSNQYDITGIATKPTPYWTNEAAEKSTTSMTFGQISLTPYKLAVIDAISKELIEDSPTNVVQLYSEQLARVIATEEDRVFAVGTGVAQPTGIDTYVLRFLNAGGALAFNHINSLYWLLPQPYRSNATWLMHQSTLAAISNFVDTNNRPILEPSGIITEPGIPALKGRPVLENNHFTPDRIWFGDLSNYYIATKGPLEIDTSEHASVGDTNFWQYNLVGIRVEERIDGELEPTQSFVEIQNTGVS